MSVEQDLIQIMQARYGRDVRQSIHDAIYDINEVAKDAQYHASTSTASAQAYADAALESERAAADAQAAAEAAAQEAMSGTPAGYADLVAEVGNLKVTTAQDEAFSLLDTHEGLALPKTIYGMSVQNGTPTPSVPVEIKNAVANFISMGKNMIPLPFSSAAISNRGVDFTFDSYNGSVSFLGTPNNSNPSTGNLHTKYFLKAGTYTVSDGVPEGADCGVSLFFYDNVSGTNYSGAYDGLLVNSSGGVFIFTTQTGGNGTSTNKHGYPKTFTINSDAYVDIQARTVNNSVTTQISGTFYPMLRLSGTSATFEKYKGGSRLTDIILRSKEVSSSQPYNLLKDGKYYVADTLVWSEENGFKVIRRIAYEQVTGDSQNLALDGSGKFFRADLQKAVSQDHTFAAGWGIVSSNRASQAVVSSSTSDNAGKIGILIANNYIRMGCDSSMCTTGDELKAWLNNNPTFIEYILETPYEETITPEQALALLSIPTFEEATVIRSIGEVESTLNLHYGMTETAAKALTGHNEGYKGAEIEAIYGCKNLIELPYYDGNSKETNGITFEVQSDGSVKANGTATGTAFFLLRFREAHKLKNGECYRFSGCPSNGSGQSWYQWLGFWNGSSNEGSAYDYGDGVDVTKVYEADTIVMGCYVLNGTTVKDLIFKPMLRLASIQSDTYVPYAMSNLELTKAVQDLIARVTTLEG